MRTLTRVLAALVGLALLVGGLVLALEVALTAARSEAQLVPYDQAIDGARQRSWDDPLVLLIGLGALLLGLLLLLLTLRRRAPLAVPGEDRQDMSVSFARKPLEQAVGRLAERSAGVENVRVTLHKNKAEVQAASLSNDLGSTKQVLQSRLDDGLQRLPLKSTPTIDVRLREAGA